MKVLNLNREDAKILFSREELLTLNNSLLEVSLQFTDHDFIALVQGISKEDSISLKDSIESILNCFPIKYSRLLQNKLISLLELSTNGLIVRLPYESILGLRSVLNVLVHEVCLNKEKFVTKEAMNKKKLSSLLHSINSQVVRKMQERKPIFIIHRKSIDIINELDFKRNNLETNSSKPRIKKRCNLHSNLHQFSFLLVSMKNRRVSSGIQISIKETSNETIIAQSDPQLIDNSDLIRFISYLELFVESAIDKADFLSYTLPTLNSKLAPLFDIQIDSNGHQYLDKKLFDIYFKLYIDNQVFEAKDNIKIDEIDSFIQSVKTFLSKLLKCSDPKSEQ